MKTCVIFMISLGVALAINGHETEQNLLKMIWKNLALEYKGRAQEVETENLQLENKVEELAQRLGTQRKKEADAGAATAAMERPPDTDGGIILPEHGEHSFIKLFFFSSSWMTSVHYFLALLWLWDSCIYIRL